MELNGGTEYFARYEANLLRFNSVKAALDRLLCMEKPEALYVPLYYCPSTTEALVRTGVVIRFYHIGSDLLPEALPDQEGDAVLLVNYFGIMDERITALARSFRHATVLLDQAHAFFCPPLMKENVFNVYSARKFFGVPDGAYAVGARLHAGQTQPHFADATAYYLLKSFERGTNAAYAEKKQADTDIAAVYAPMSELAVGLLKNADYEAVRARRLRNFEAFHAALGCRNKLHIAAPAPAYMYPFLCENGQELKTRLVREKIYVPTLWNGEMLRREGNAFELDMSDNAVFLPIDQRYGETDLAFLISTVEENLC